MKTDKTKDLLLETLRQMPIVELSCKKVGVSRATFYRWKRDDKEFTKAVDNAILEGENLVTDMSESQLISLVKDRNFQAIHLWLKVHHKKYSDKVEISFDKEMVDKAWDQVKKIIETGEQWKT